MNQKLAQLKYLLIQLAALLGFPPTEKATPQTPVSIVPPHPSTHASRVHDLAWGIQAAEGWPKCAGFPLNNPGDIKWHVASDGSVYAKELGATHAVGPFAVWPTYQAGFQGLIQFCTDACSGKLPAYREKTLEEFIIIYTADPAGSLKHVGYMTTVLGHLKAEPNEKISNFL